MRVMIISILMLISSTTFAWTPSFNGGYLYDGKGLTASDPFQQARDHICLSFMIFLEARGDGESSQMFHGMATIQRALNSKRWATNICSVISERNQYESIKAEELEVIVQVMMGNSNAIDEYIERKFKSSIDRQRWLVINTIAYNLIIAKSTEGFLDADHFYAPRDLKRRSLPVPEWISKMQVVAISGDTYFLK